jgi:hypothetical protein
LPSFEPYDVGRVHVSFEPGFWRPQAELALDLREHRVPRSDDGPVGLLARIDEIATALDLHGTLDEDREPVRALRRGAHRTRETYASPMFATWIGDRYCCSVWFTVTATGPDPAFPGIEIVCHLLGHLCHRDPDPHAPTWIAPFPPARGR